MLGMVLGVVSCPSARGSPGSAPSLPALKVSDDRRFLVDAEGRPFFYFADTAWKLFHCTDRKQAVEYLDKRAGQRFAAGRADEEATTRGPARPLVAAQR